MKIGFIGAGQMAQAIIKGLDKNKFEIFISGRDLEKTKDMAGQLSVGYKENNKQLATDVDFVILSVKPQVLPRVLEDIKDEVKGKTILSIAAGLTIQNLEDLSSEKQAVIRVMPNINASIGESTTAICHNSNTDQASLESAKEIFESVGMVYEIEEKDFSTFAAIAGSSPAFIYIFIDALSRAGVLHGIPKVLATQIVAQTVKASAQMIQETGENPWSLVDKVSSPGGTTVEGVVSLEDNKFVASVIQAVTQTVEKDKRL